MPYIDFRCNGTPEGPYLWGGSDYVIKLAENQEVPQDTHFPRDFLIIYYLIAFRYSFALMPVTFLNVRAKWAVSA